MIVDRRQTPWAVGPRRRRGRARALYAVYVVLSPTARAAARGWACFSLRSAPA